MTAKKWTLTSIQARGYCGIGSVPQLVDFDRPIAVITGANGSGKSTWVSAIEWALFGELNYGKEFSVTDLAGMGLQRYRVYMHQGCPESEVILQFRSGNSKMQWRRLRSRKQPKPHHDKVACIVDGKKKEPNPENIFGLTRELFSRTIAPCQGNLQALVSAEDKERNAALDLLFGIEKINTLAAGLSRARRDLKPQLDRLELRLDGLSNKLRHYKAAREQAKSAAWQKALEAGLAESDISLDGGAALVNSISGALSVPLLKGAPTITLLQDAYDYLRSEADRQWSELPHQERLNRLQEVYNILGQANSQWESALAAYRRTLERLSSDEKRIGTEAEVNRALAESQRQLDDITGQIGAASSRAAALWAARDWLGEQGSPAVGDIDCPVCGKSEQIGVLGELVGEAIASLQGANGLLQQLEAQKKVAKAILDTHKENQKSMERSAKEYQIAANVAQEQLNSAIEALETALDLWISLAPDSVEQPAFQQCRRALMQALETMEGLEVGQLNAEGLRLEMRKLLDSNTGKLPHAIAVTQQEREKHGKTVASIRQRVLGLDYLIQFLKAEAELARQDGDRAGREAIAARSRLEEVKTGQKTLEAIVKVAGEVFQSMAEERVGAISGKFNDWFERMSQHDRLTKARIDVESSKSGGIVKNIYKLRASDSTGSWSAAPGPMLSGGYQTILSIAALLAMAEVEGGGHQLGFLALDEPTQNLDPEMAKLLGKALGIDLPTPQIILTTTNESFVEAIESFAGADRVRVVRLNPWTAKEGTSLRVD